MKIAFPILFLLTFAQLNAQKLNEAYLRANAAMINGSYNEVSAQILSIPENERTAAMCYTLGEAHYLGGRYQDAIAAFEKAEALRTASDNQLYIARSYAQLGQPDKACEWLQKYLAQRDKLFESELTLDPALEKLERSKEWRALWEKDWYNASEKKAAEAANLIKRKKYADALMILDSELEQRSSSDRLLVMRGKAYVAMTQDNAALDNYRKAIGVRNNRQDYYAETAAIAVRLKKYDEALDDINRAIRLAPYSFDLYLQRSGILRMAQKYDEARKDLDFYFTYLPADTKALYQMGVNETANGNAISGIEFLSQVLEKETTSAEYFLARADAYFKADRYELAENDIAQALDLNPKLPEAWLKKGIASYQVNQIENACYYWRKALDLGNKESSTYIYKYCTDVNLKSTTEDW